MIIGSHSGWLTLSGSTARPAAISSRTTSGGRPSRIATNSISGVTTPARAYASWVGRWESTPARGVPAPRTGATSPRSAIHGPRSGGSPTSGSEPGPEVS